MWRSLRFKVLMAVLAAVAITDALAVWTVNRHISAGAEREAEAQARAQSSQAQAILGERLAGLLAEGEAVSFYPAVIAAIAEGNARPLLTWSSQVAKRQQTNVTVVDRDGKVIARGVNPDQAGDQLAGKLPGLQRALGGEMLSGVEDGDGAGLALRGYAPVLRDGSVVGAVMIADRLDGRMLSRLAGGPASVSKLALVDGSADGGCRRESVETASCRFAAPAPGGGNAATLELRAPLTSIEATRRDAMRSLWLLGGLVLAGGALAGVVLATTITRPLGRLETAAARIAAGDYDSTVPAAGDDEVGTLARAFETMRASVRGAHAAVREERDLLDAVLESTGDGILMTDTDGARLVGNRRWADLTGGESLAAAADLAPLGGDSGAFGVRSAHWLTEPERGFTADLERHEPVYARFRCYSAPVHRGGRIAGRIFVLRDVTRESEAERMRTALVSTVSHELRSPLTAIKGYTDALLESGPWDDDTEREFLEIIASSTGKLSHLVDNLLDAAKVDAGVLQLEREPVRVERIARQVVEQRWALLTNHKLTLDVAGALPLADADPFRVEQVLTNLVENAIKYSPEGGEITVKVATRGDNVAVSVQDQGVGIPPEHVEKLFDRFYRIDNRLARTTKGVGLGLYICKSLVEAHGGRIWVQSRAGAGSMFGFTLPALREESEAVPPRSPAATIRLNTAQGVAV